MLAARTAWAILESEHAHMRRLLASMAVILGASDGNWCRPGASQTRLRRLIDTLQAFDRASHRPKGVAMLQAMSGRSAPADRQLAKLSLERARSDAELLDAKASLDAIGEGHEAACSDCRALLVSYHDGLLRQMEEEETLLRGYAEQLLTEEEWSRVVSDISTLHSRQGRAGQAAGSSGRRQSRHQV